MDAKEIQERTEELEQVENKYIQRVKSPARRAKEALEEQAITVAKTSRATSKTSK